MSDKVFLEQTPQEILNIIEALQFYKDSIIKPKYRNKIDEQLEDIGKQLQLQNINVFIKDFEVKFKFGDLVTYDGKDGIIIGTSNEDNFIKIAVFENNKISMIDVPVVLINK